MDDSKTLSQLEELAARLGINIRYESLKIGGAVHLGGFCRIKGEDFLIINKKATSMEKIHFLIDALKRRDLSEIYIIPSLRKILDNQDVQP
ncbi:MAG: hypothetical protein MUF26_05855 [Syntrophales bacterium]|jgi:hypothetical protein|nr:hypothetical protein [Syntrophales bacterium]